MSTLAEKLHKWSIQELNLVSEGGVSGIPDVESLKLLTKGKNKKIWTYVINHVRSRSAVDKNKRTLCLKKQIAEKEEHVVPYNDNSTDHVKLQTALSKAIERRCYLMRSMSSIEVRILNLEQIIKNTRDEVFQTSQKAALLEHLKRLYEEKNSNLKCLFYQISSYKNDLTVYQNTKSCDKTAGSYPCEFLFENKAVYGENSSRVRDLIAVSSSILRKKFSNDNENINALFENFQSNRNELKKRSVLLTDFVILLEEVCGSELQQFTSLSIQNLSVKEYLFNKSKQRMADDHLKLLKCESIYNSLSAKKNRNDIGKLLVTKQKLFEEFNENTSAELSDCELKCILFEKQAENEALVASNDFMESYLNDVADKTDILLKSIRQKSLCNDDLISVLQMFHSDADLTFYLSHTASDATKKVLCCLDDLRAIAHEKLFEMPLPSEECIEKLKVHFVSNRKSTWAYCNRTNLINSLSSESLANYTLTPEFRQSLNIQPFQNISFLCENWFCFKQKLWAEVAANAEALTISSDVNVSDMYSKFLQMLEKMKFSIEKGMVRLSDGITCCHKTKSLIQEWWDQDAQYIPSIQYEGKTLKMWIDILTVLSDFEPQNYV